MGNVDFARSSASVPRLFVGTASRWDRAEWRGCTATKPDCREGLARLIQQMRRNDASNCSGLWHTTNVPRCPMLRFTSTALHGVFDDLEFNPEYHHADRRSRDRQKNDDRCLGATQRAMFSVEVSAYPVVE
jgi:hypothetical protein